MVLLATLLAFRLNTENEKLKIIKKKKSILLSVDRSLDNSISSIQTMLEKVSINLLLNKNFNLSTSMDIDTFSNFQKSLEDGLFEVEQEKFQHILSLIKLIKIYFGPTSVMDGYNIIRGVLMSLLYIKRELMEIFKNKNLNFNSDLSLNQLCIFCQGRETRNLVCDTCVDDRNIISIINEDRKHTPLMPGFYTRRMTLIEIPYYTSEQMKKRYSNTEKQIKENIQTCESFSNIYKSLISEFLTTLNSFAKLSEQEAIIRMMIK